jgi:hypothetical protein
MAHSSLPLYFGLGAAAAVDRVEVTWPSGEVQTLDGDGLAIDRTLEIVEPAANPASIHPARSAKS